MTFIIKLFLLPFSMKSSKSMGKMQELQPQIAAIKEKYKDDSQVMNAKVMELYKKHGANPMGGCLPLIFQLPVFFALYNVLNDSIGLRYSSFLWIKDLSAPDTVATMPFSLPFLGSSLNILPIIMVIVQFLQQKLNKNVDPNQKMMMYLMPLIFIGIFWNMPSGLVLYWTVQNIFSILEQEYHKLKRKTSGSKSIEPVSK
ncbi:MAG: membrane protein insertase YidC, partial [Actinomycetia bacterium]|nr:membrane protein insertase YidC [Actinomycetes bacterium]